MSDWQQFVDDQIDLLKRKSLLRYQRVVQSNPASSVNVEVNGKQKILFSSNDYLGLSCHPEVCQEIGSSAKQYGCGVRSSALISGLSAYHRDLEIALADLKSTQECLLYPTGFAANMGTISSLCGNSETAIFSDELNHASIIEGARLASKSGAQLFVYRHNDIAHLSQLLIQCSPQKKRKIVVSDSLFSMDGDWADLQGLVNLKKHHMFMLALDEAHATLVVGEKGAGLADKLNLEHEVDLQIGTLSKAFGCQGGFVCCSNQMKQLLWNKSRPLVFSTALPVPIVCGALAALKVSQREQWRRAHLFRLIELINSQWGTNHSSPIIPFIVGSENKALHVSQQLMESGFLVGAIRPPTVPANTSRLRIGLSAGHSESQVRDLLHSMQLQLKNSSKL